MSGFEGNRQRCTTQRRQLCGVNLAYKTQLMISGIRGFYETSFGCQAWCPLPDKCTIVLLQVSFQLDDEDKDITETHVGIQTEGSKTLAVKSKRIVVWLPSVCCSDSSECGLARNGQCRRAPGVVLGRDAKRTKKWWDRVWQ